jgi:hypothetical protein
MLTLAGQKKDVDIREDNGEEEAEVVFVQVETLVKRLTKSKLFTTGPDVC